MFSVFTNMALLADDTPPITPAEAATKINQKVVVKMEVKSTGGKNNFYLNSEEDFKDAKNFTIFISKDHVEKFKKAGVENPSMYYKGKTIQVTGTVVLEKADGTEKKPWIKVEEPDQIKVITKENP
jgi:hypothetical protein